MLLCLQVRRCCACQGNRANYDIASPPSPLLLSLPPLLFPIPPQPLATSLYPPNTPHTGAAAAILAVRYLAVVKPASAGLEPWTTGQKGSALVALISASILVPGLLALWVALGVLAWQQRSSGSSGASKAAAGGSNGGMAAVLPVSTSIGGAAAASASAAASSNKKSDRRGKKGRCDLTSHLLAGVQDGTMSPADTPTAAEAVTAVAANPFAPPATAGSYNSTTSSLSAVAAAAVAADGFATIRAGAGGGWELVLPERDAADDAEGTNDAGELALVFELLFGATARFSPVDRAPLTRQDSAQKSS